ncbi:hypothetical protein A2V68_03125 [candidate division Kazan bacterium RBG_13_50_9]|uniref:50S ribosomal protein L7/L12 n=1 Tax=candidate division Kazan bacterium RBG_13_50_9 TaxID=1798535 RepID=A0A1F4NTD2_UNCK3|nr:MAG: hypothetical protein A2V68_03125 [candidate division Kazan bacterium RBG_13_50_9]
MSKDKRLEKVRALIETASANISTAKQLLTDMLGTVSSSLDYQSKAQGLPSSGKVIEGVFEGQYMMDKDGKKYPVPANYASKSKLVAGDVLKLTIMEDGSFIYKQIGPVARKKVIGTLIEEDGEYRIVAGGKSYRALMASVTYFKAKPGDELTVLIPEEAESEWAAIESAVIEPGAEIPKKDTGKSKEK